MLTTPIYELPYPEGTDPAAGPSQIRQLAERIEAVVDLVIPVGSIELWSLAVPPTNWLICDGAAVPDGLPLKGLMNNTPDLRGRVPVGAGTATGDSTATAKALGALGGNEAVALIAGQLPSHTHADGTLTTAAAGSHNHSGATAAASTPDHHHSMGAWTVMGSNNWDQFRSQLVTWGAGYSFPVAAAALGDHDYWGTDRTQGSLHSLSHGHGISTQANHSHDVTGATAATGSGQTHSNLQPYHVLNYIIRAA